jgi:hypothetical protein
MGIGSHRRFRRFRSPVLVRGGAHADAAAHDVPLGPGATLSELEHNGDKRKDDEGADPGT